MLDEEKRRADKQIGIAEEKAAEDRLEHEKDLLKKDVQIKKLILRKEQLKSMCAEYELKLKECLDTDNRVE